MTRFGVLALAVGFAAALLFAAPAFAAQPFPLNYKTFDLSRGTPVGVTYSGGSLKLANPGGSYCQRVRGLMGTRRRSSSVRR